MLLQRDHEASGVFELPGGFHDHLLIGYTDVRFWHRQCRGGRRVEATYVPGRVNVLPARDGFTWEWKGEQAFRSCHTYLAPSMLRRVAEDAMGINPDRLQLRHAFDVLDPRLQTMLSLLHRELPTDSEPGEPGGASLLYVEGISLGLALHLIRNYSTQALRDVVRPGALTDREVAVISDYVEAHLHEPIRLDDLAAALKLSVFHFSRRFKRATGQTPHQFVMDRRVERACVLLTDPRQRDRTIASIAQECGFANPSHLGRHLRRVVGMTPSAFRRAR